MHRIVLFILILPFLGIAAGIVWVANNLPGIFDGLGPILVGFVILSGSMITLPRLRRSIRSRRPEGRPAKHTAPRLVSSGTTTDEIFGAGAICGELIIEASSSRDIQNNMSLPVGCVIRTIEPGWRYRVLFKLEPGLSAVWYRAGGYKQTSKEH